MKRISILFIAGLFSLFMASCGNGEENEPTNEELFAEAIAGEWTLSSAQVPASSATTNADWDDFTVNFNSGTVTASGSPAVEVWPNQGLTYTLSATSPSNGSVAISGAVFGSASASISNNNLTLSFDVPTGTEVTRTLDLSGSYTLVFSK